MSRHASCKRHFVFLVQLWLVVIFVYVIKFGKKATFQVPTRLSCENEVIHKVGESEYLQIISNLVPSDLVPNMKEVSVLVQGDISKLHHIPDLAESWNGPIEVVVYSFGGIDHVVSIILQLRSYFPAVRNHVTWHYVAPHDAESPARGCPELESKVALLPPSDDSCESECENLLTNLKSDVCGGSSDRWFPVNVLRNVARNNTKTAMHLTLDIDLTLSDGLRERFLDFSERHHLFDDSDKVVYVLPAFEYHPNAESIPRNIQQLLYQYYVTMNTRIFHDWCTSCYHLTGYDEWFKTSRKNELIGENDVSISHYIKWRVPLEPYVIASNGIPLFPEQFRGYGYNKVSQSCETAAAGYKFGVLSNSFVVHDGWKSPTKGNKKKQLDYNTQLWKEFQESIAEKYTT